MDVPVHRVNRKTLQPSYRWPAAFTATLKRMWAEGHSTIAIAKALGPPFTRMAVAGKVNRLGLEKRPPRGKNAPKSPPPPPCADLVHGVTLPKVALSPVYSDERPIGPEGSQSEVADGPVTFMQLTARHCRHPLWAHFERPSVHTSLYCGCRVTPGRIYCEAHAGSNYEEARHGA